MTFLHQRVWCTDRQKLVHLTEPLPSGFEFDTDACCGPDMGADEAREWVGCGAAPPVLGALPAPPGSKHPVMANPFSVRPRAAPAAAMALPPAGKPGGSSVHYATGYSGHSHSGSGFSTFAQSAPTDRTIPHHVPRYTASSCPAPLYAAQFSDDADVLNALLAQKAPSSAAKQHVAPATPSVASLPKLLGGGNPFAKRVLTKHSASNPFSMAGRNAQRAGEAPGVLTAGTAATEPTGPAGAGAPAAGLPATKSLHEQAAVHVAPAVGPGGGQPPTAVRASPRSHSIALPGLAGVASATPTGRSTRTSRSASRGSAEGSMSMSEPMSARQSTDGPHSPVGARSTLEKLSEEAMLSFQGKTLRNKGTREGAAESGAVTGSPSGRPPTRFDQGAGCVGGDELASVSVGVSASTAASHLPHVGAMAAGGELARGETVGGETVGGETVEGETVGGETVEGETVGGETVGGETVGGETVGGEETCADVDIQKEDNDSDRVEDATEAVDFSSGDVVGRSSRAVGDAEKLSHAATPAMGQHAPRTAKVQTRRHKRKAPKSAGSSAKASKRSSFANGSLTAATPTLASFWGAAT